MTVVRYLAVLEQAECSWAAYSPDVPGCVANGDTPDDALAKFAEALQLHLEGLLEDGLPLPEPRARAEYVTAQV